MSVCVSWPEIEFCCYCSVFVLRYFWKRVLCFFIFVLVYKAISLSVFNDSWTLACFCTRCALIWGLHNMLFTCCQLVLKVLKPNVTLTAFISEFVCFLDAYHHTSGSDSYWLIFEAIQNALDEISCSCVIRLADHIQNKTAHWNVFRHVSQPRARMNNKASSCLVAYIPLNLLVCINLQC